MNNETKEPPTAIILSSKFKEQIAKLMKQSIELHLDWIEERQATNPAAEHLLRSIEPSSSESQRLMLKMNGH
jgi:hypothetical protein